MIDRRRFTTAALATAAIPFLPARPAHASRRGIEHFSWSPLGKNTHLYEEGGGNVLLVPGNNASILIDTKNPGLGDTLKREAESRAPRIGLTINTHHHGDHTGGNYAFTAASALVAHASAAPRIESQFKRYTTGLTNTVRSGATDELKREAESRLEALDEMEGAWAPTRTIEGKQSELSAGGRTIVAHHVGNGHTDNDLILHLEDENLLHFGDLIFNGLHPYCDASAGVSIRGWIVSLKAGLKLADEKTIVVPGHGPVTDRAGISKQIDYFQQLIDHVNEQITLGTPREEIAQMTFPFMEGLGFDRIRPIAIGVAYDEILGS